MRFFPLFCRFQTARNLCKKVLPQTAENLCLDLGCWEGEEFYKGLDVLGNHGLSGLLEESPYEKSPKMSWWGFRGIWGILQRSQSINYRSIQQFSMKDNQAVKF